MATDLAAFLERPAPAVARDLIGWTLLVDGCGGRLVEVEAYTQDDPASHTRMGPTKRNWPMFGPPAHAYVYRSYGIHWCLNLVCQREGLGAAVLIRALVPEHGRERIAERRAGRPERDWCRGPGALCAALGIDQALNGASLEAPPVELRPPESFVPVLATRRIGITRAVERPWRFVEAGSPWASGPRSLNRLSP
jgi:DNA-3-methyladenine glycosylase